MLRFAPAVEAAAMGSILHFYPGHFPPVDIDRPTGASLGPGLLIALNGKTVLFRGEAWGGPSRTINIPGEPPATPTPTGTFVLRDPEPYFTKSWVFSEIRWGTPIKPSPNDPTDVWYAIAPKATGGEPTWASIKRDFGITRQQVEEYYKRLYGVAKLPKVWVFNAFGPVAVRFFRDLNRNRKLDKGEVLEGAMFHTTPENEAELRSSRSLQMVPSHGCIHMQPPDRDRLLGMGILKAGTVLVIHPYSQKYVGP